MNTEKYVNPTTFVTVFVGTMHTKTAIHPKPGEEKWKDDWRYLGKALAAAFKRSGNRPLEPIDENAGTRVLLEIGDDKAGSLIPFRPDSDKWDEEWDRAGQIFNHAYKNSLLA